MLLFILHFDIGTPHFKALLKNLTLLYVPTVVVHSLYDYFIILCSYPIYFRVSSYHLARFRSQQPIKFLYTYLKLKINNKKNQFCQFLLMPRFDSYYFHSFPVKDNQSFSYQQVSRFFRNCRDVVIRILNQFILLRYPVIEFIKLYIIRKREKFIFLFKYLLLKRDFKIK